MTQVKLKLNRQAMAQVKQEAGQTATRRAAEATVRRTRANITRKGRVDTGKMLSSVKARPSPSGNDPGYAVGSDLSYFDYQEKGTRGHTMPRGKFMVFRGRGGTLVFARSVKGVKAGHFMRDALAALSERDFAGP